MKISIDNVVYDISEEIGGDILKMVILLEKGVTKVTTPDGPINQGTNAVAEFLKTFLLNRMEALKIVKYREHTWTDIVLASYDVAEMDDKPHYDYDPPDSLKGNERQALIDKQREIARSNRREYNKSRLKEAVTLLPWVQEHIGWERLDWVQYFHETVNKAGDEYLGMLGLHPLMAEMIKALKKYYPDRKYEYYQLIPEEVDWNLYLEVRGPMPEKFEGGQYSHILDLCWKMEKVRTDKIKVYPFFDRHPKEVETLLTYGITTSDDAPKPTEISSDRMVSYARDYLKEKERAVKPSKGSIDQFIAAEKLMKQGLSADEALRRAQCVS